MRASKNPTLDRRQEGERFGLSQFLAGCILQLPLGAQPVHAGRWRGTQCVRDVALRAGGRDRRVASGESLC